MQDISLMVNQVIEDLQSNSFYRILWISPDRTEAYWIPMDGNARMPKEFQPGKVLEGIDQNVYALVPDRWMPPVSEVRTSHAQKRDHAWNLICDIVAKEPAIYRSRERTLLLRQISEDKNIKVPNIYVYLVRYWRGGKVADALLPHYENCGKNAGGGTDARRGRKKTEGAEGKTLTAEDYRIFTESVLEWYMGKEQLSLEKTFQNMLGKYYTTNNENGLPVRFSPDEIPSRNQFLYWHRKNRNVLEEEAARKGKRSYTLENRGETGKTETYLSGPCMSAQIDATIADIFLVSRTDRTAIVGRPVMYFLMDSYSRMVMGMYISLDAPSWRSAAQCILNAAEDKKDFCAEYGVSISPEEWPCMHIPNTIVADRGEMETATADLLVKTLGIRLEVMPPYRGDLKGIIERHFATIDIHLTDLPGKMKKDYGKRCTEDYRLGAKLDIWQFTQIIIRLVLLYNNYHYLEYYKKSTHMRLMNVMSVPREIWKYGIKYHSGGQRILSRETLRYALYPSGTGTITPHGIRFQGLLYGCRKAFEERWFDSARTVGQQEISLSYNPRDVSVIYIRPSSDQSPVACTLLDSEKMDFRLTSAEVEQMRTADTEEKNRHKAEEDFQTVVTNREISRIVKDAEEMSAASGTDKSNAQRLREIADNRRKEVELQTTEPTSSSEVHQDNPPAAGDPDSEELTPIQKEIRKLLGHALAEEGYHDEYNLQDGDGS